MLLVIGSKRFSSWSLRPWILLKQFEIPFEEKLILLDQSHTKSEILKFSPSAKVPVLIDGENRIWESIAIAEYLNEKFPNLGLWPRDQNMRALARSVSNEMHAGFSDLRNYLPHDLNKKTSNFDWSIAKSDVQRIFKIWDDCLGLSKGPFLFGSFSIADAMYAPVVNRFVTYGVPAEGICLKYIETIRELPALKAWWSDASKE